MNWGTIQLDIAKRLLLGADAGAYVKDAADLLPALADDLETHFSSTIQEDGDLLFLADDEHANSDHWRPARREHVWQAYLRRYLSLRMGRVFFGREVQVGAQEFPDLVAVPLGGSSAGPEEVVIEIKLSDHAEVLTAIDSQLASRYLNGTTRRHGIYLTIYLEGAKKAGSRNLQAHGLKPTLEGYRTYLARKAAIASSGDTVVRAVVIDARHPPSSNRKRDAKKPATSKIRKRTLAKQDK